MPHLTARHFLLISSLCVVISLVACGGSGGGTSVTPAPMVTISGVTAKGLIKNGVVQIYTTDTNGNISEQPIATTKTDANGAYSVNIPAQFSAVLATVTPALDNSTTVANDLNPGEADSALPADFKMSAVIGGVSTDTTLSITPYSTLAVQAAKQGGKLLSSHANITNQYVKTYLLNGIDPVATRPSMSTKSDNPNELAMTAALLAVDRPWQRVYCPNCSRRKRHCSWVTVLCFRQKDRLAIQINVFPTNAEQFAKPHSRFNGQHHKTVKVVCA